MDLAYRKIYGTDRGKGHRRGARLRLAGAALLLALCLHGGLRETVLELVIPGDRRETGQALEAMAQALRRGQTLTGALEAFCLEVLDDDP